MTARVWKRIALTSTLLVWAATSQAQSTGGAPAAQTGSPQVRPAPVSGRVTADPAAVALRPAGQQAATSTARQVPPPANPNEPLLAPESESGKPSPSTARPTQSPHIGQDGTQPAATPTRPHLDRTHGVKRAKETQSRPHERKVKGKPHHAGKGASSAASKDEPRKGSKGGGKQSAASQGVKQGVKQGVATAKSSPKKLVRTGKSVRESSQTGEMQHQKPGATRRAQTDAKHTAQAKKAAAVKRQTVAGKARHHAPAASAAKASGPVAKKPLRHKQPSA